MKNLVGAIWEYYFAHNGLKDPDFGFSPDAEFPIINGEKGNITAYLILKVKMMGTLVLCPLMVVCVKIWFLNQQVQILLDLSL